MTVSIKCRTIKKRKYDASQSFNTVRAETNYIIQLEMNNGLKTRLDSVGVEELVRQLDENDPLKKLRGEFHIPKVEVVTAGKEGKDGGEAIYLCGNSLGLQPKEAIVLLEKELKRWSEEGVEAQLCGEEGQVPWAAWDEVCIADMANLVGAEVDEVVLMNSLTVNIQLMLATFYNPTPNKNKILTHSSAFPSDTMALRSHIRLRGYDPDECLIIIGPRPGEELLREEDLISTLEKNADSIAVVWVEGVHYLTGQFLDVALLAEEARNHGVIFGVDLAHAAGNVQLDLHGWNVDFAVWCSYKYLNSGPGGIGGCFIHQRHLTTPLPRLSGWWGSQKSTRFRMDPTQPWEGGAMGYQLSNPPILCLATLRASLNIYARLDKGMTSFRAKSALLTGLLELLLRQRLPRAVKVITGQRRGCQLTLEFTTAPAKKVLEDLKGHGVICDFREPDRLRVAPNPLYNSFSDVARFVDILANLLNKD
ncbi:kynureninase [Folsomia candida]|uniref:kynureninase n=1 Tax=Folsomia candida TaxID=158441 RepID=UPI001604AB55|nr:kynureninase [Folsomia candida]